MWLSKRYSEGAQLSSPEVGSKRLERKIQALVKNSLFSREKIPGGKVPENSSQEKHVLL